jgi:phospholipid-translocating ATPase
MTIKQIVLVLLSMCLFCTIACGVWETITGSNFQIYLPWDSAAVPDPENKLAGKIS